MANTAGQDPDIRRLERQAERTRAELVDTVDELRNRVSDTVSPSHLKHDVKDYVSRTGQDVFQNLKEKAYQHPLQAVAIGAGVAYPVWRMLRSVPVPILLLGAGMALAGRQGRLPAIGSRRWSGNGSGRIAQGGTSTHGRYEPSYGGAGEYGTYQRRYSGAEEGFGYERHDYSSGSRAEFGAGRPRHDAPGLGGQLSDMAGRLGSAVSSGVSTVASKVENLFGAGGRERGQGMQTGRMRSHGYGDYADYATREPAAAPGYRQRWDQNALVEAAQRHRYLVGGGTLLLGAMLARSLTGRNGARSRTKSGRRW